MGGYHWALLRLVYAKGLTHHEVAKLLDIQPAVVSRDVAHGLRVLAGVVLGEVDRA